MSKKRCHLTLKEYEAKKDIYALYSCAKCGRLANEKKKLCKIKKKK